jgi:hypothetical protein
MQWGLGGSDGYNCTTLTLNPPTTLLAIASVSHRKMTLMGGGQTGSPGIAGGIHFWCPTPSGPPAGKSPGITQQPPARKPGPGRVASGRMSPIPFLLQSLLPTRKGIALSGG